jgi:predicted ATPase
LLGRLDRLGPSAKNAAQVGAAIGRDFSYELLAAAAPLAEPELQEALRRLVEAGLVFQRGAPPMAEYLFKHALVQDTAHSTLLRGPRQALHRRIAEALEQRFPDLVETRPEILAHHYGEAGLAERSIVYWRRAGRNSAARSAMAEAVAQFQKGLDQLTMLPDTVERRRQELELRSSQGAVLFVLKGHAALETGQAYSRARELWEELGSPSEFLRVPYGQARYHVVRGEFDLALRLDEDLLRLSQQRSDAAGLVLGHYSSARNLMFAGRFASSRAHLEEVLALYDPISHRSLIYQAGDDPHANAQGILGIVIFCLGYPDRALVQSKAAIDEARRLVHPPSLASVLALGNMLASLVGDDAALNGRAKELVDMAVEQGFPWWGAQGGIYLGWAKVKKGELAEGTSRLHHGLSAHRATGAELWMPHHITRLATAYELTGQIEHALARSDEALQIVERTGERWFEAELHRHKGQLLLRQGHSEAAENLYGKALSIAEEQGAKLWELRAATSLARLWGEQGRRAEAQELLAPAYGWFTEGFDTADLKEAKALLDALA